MALIYVKDKNQFDEYVKLNGLTQLQLANTVNIGSTYLSAIKNKKKSVGVKTAKKICEVLNVEMDTIFMFISSTKVLQSDSLTTS